MALPAIAASDPDTDGDLAAHVGAIAARLDPRVAATMARIDGTGRRLLALRSYLRSGAQLTERWSWTQEQIGAYEGTAEHRALQEEIAHVREAFVRENPGFELWVNPQVRSLDIQIASWNENDSVAAAADNLLAAAQDAVASSCPERIEADLTTFLESHVPTPTPTVAAPGLSPHGQMRAVDFQVHKDGQVVAGPRTATIDSEWDGAGWTARLDAAVREASSRFVGPLATPREPWHYTFTPDAVAARQ